MSFWRVAFNDALYGRNPGELAVYAPDAETARAAAEEYLKNETLYARPYVVTDVTEVSLTRPAVFEAYEGPGDEWPRLHREPGPDEEEEPNYIPWWYFRLLLPDEQATDEALVSIRRAFRGLLANWLVADDVLEPVWEAREDLRFGRPRTLALVELELHNDGAAASRDIPPLLRWAERTADEFGIAWNVSLDDDDLGTIAAGQPASEQLWAAVRF